MESLWELTNALSNGTIPTPYGLPFAKIKGSQIRKPNTKLLFSRTANLADIFIGSIRTKVHEKFWIKGRVGVSRDWPNFLNTPYYLRTG